MAGENKNFLKENWAVVVWIVAAIFAAGGIYAEFSSLKMELNVVHERLDKKIVVIDKLEQRIYDIEKRIEYEKGYNDSQRNLNK
jgi:hypothetical protein